MERLQQLVGNERPVEEVSRELYFHVHSLRPPVVGAVQVTCADESEHECASAFQRGFVEHLLPRRKFGQQAAFRLSNLGGRYEWGAIRIAEEHFAIPETHDAFKLLVVKINAHVAAEEKGGKERFGEMTRYGAPSTCCGALHGLLSGSRLPAIESLREAFQSEHRDRIEALLDPARVDPELRSLFAGLVSARLQARHAMLEIQEHHPKTPTFYVVLPCVTFNRPDRDTEIVCGVYSADRRTHDAREEYVGLGDDPARYRLEKRNLRYAVADDDSPRPRAARNHRELVLETWRERGDGRLPDDHRIEKVREHVRKNRHHDGHQARKILKGLLPILADIAPVPAAVRLFASGVAGIHHVHRAHRLAREVASSDEAREILDDVRARVDSLDGDHARAVVELLAREYV